MKPFQYTYLGRVLSATADHYTEGRYNRYRITLGKETFIIAPSGFTGANGRTIWVQPVKPGEKDQHHDLVQALGEGLEAYGIIRSMQNRQRKV